MTSVGFCRAQHSRSDGDVQKSRYSILNAMCMDGGYERNACADYKTFLFLVKREGEVAV